MINTKNIDDDDERCLVRYLHPATYHLAKIRNVNKTFESKSHFKDIKIPIKFKGIRKFEKELYSYQTF